MNTKSITAMLIVIILVIGVGYVAYSYYRTSVAPPTSTSGKVSFTVALTDPPTVPAGTTALYLNYSKVELITNSSPYYANFSGKVDLLSLINTSRIIAVVNIPKNVTVNQIRLDVSSVTITVNGSNYSVFVPSRVLKIPITNATSGALVDLMPHVVVAYSGHSERFILTPVALAIPFSAEGAVGQEVPMPKSVVNELGRVHTNITVVSSSLTFNDNETTFNITLKNEGSENAVIYAITLEGPWSMTLNALPHPLSSASQQIQVNMPIFFFVNGTSLVPFSAPHLRSSYQLMNALNGSIANAYVLQPGTTVTFTFHGVITPVLAAKFSQLIVLLPVSGQAYGLKVISSPPSFINYSLTAGS